MGVGRKEFAFAATSNTRPGTRHRLGTIDPRGSESLHPSPSIPADPSPSIAQIFKGAAAMVCGAVDWLGGGQTRDAVTAW
jgi:hypothetical protein